MKSWQRFRGLKVTRTQRAGRVAAATLALAAAGDACADWLAGDPGTPISVQINPNGGVVIRPLGATWSQALCSDVTAAVLREPPHILPHAGSRSYDLLVDVLVTAAANGSLVNLNTPASSAPAFSNGLTIGMACA
jgi:hypothetical protein